MRDTVNNVNMRKAAIDQIIVWIVLFMLFATSFIFVIKYSQTVRLLDNTKALADYGARMKALNKEDSTIASGLNNLKVSGFGTIDENNISCTTTADGSYLVIFIVTGPNPNSEFGSADLSSKAVVYNETNSSKVECSLTLGN